MKKYNERKRAFIERYIDKMRKEQSTVLNIGAGKYDFLKGIVDPFCGECISIDIDKKLFPKIDYELDVCELTTVFKEDQFDIVLAFDVFEHVHNPFKMVSEVSKVLKPKGFFLITTPFTSPLHGEGIVKDYWRITEDGFRELLKHFRKVIVTSSGGIENYPGRYYVEARK